MLPRIEAYIREHENKWPVEISRSGRLTPLIRFNKEANADVEREKIGRVILWFDDSSTGPVLVTKIMDASVPLDLIASCALRQQGIDKMAGWPIFPDVYDATLISDKPVVFMEAIDTPSYQLELAKAIFGPAGNIQLLKNIVERQFNEIGALFALLAKTEVSRETEKWGDWAFNVGQQFRDGYGLDEDCVSDGSLKIMAKHIDSLALQRNFVLVDHYCANYFAGPRVVDQMDSSLDRRMSGEPGLLDLFRFIVAYFRTSPIETLYPDWVGAIAASLHDESGRSIYTGPAMRQCLRKLGLNLNRVPEIWALVMVTFFLRAMDERDFYRNSAANLSHIRTAFETSATTLVHLQKSIERGDYQVNEGLGQRVQWPRSLPRAREYGSPVRLKLIAETENYNIVRADEHHLAIVKDLGPINLFEERIGDRELTPCLLIADTLEEVTAKAERMKPLVQLVVESRTYKLLRAGQRFLALVQRLAPWRFFATRRESFK